MLESIVIDKSKLLEILTQNKDNHEKAFNKAFENWSIAYMDMLKELEQRALRGQLIPFSMISLAPPVSYVESYDTAIQMLLLTNQQEITLYPDDFRELVQDKWNWKNQFSISNSSYSSSSSSRVITILEDIERNINREK